MAVSRTAYFNVLVVDAAQVTRAVCTVLTPDQRWRTR
jgi:hypothetical protein